MLNPRSLEEDVLFGQKSARWLHRVADTSDATLFDESLFLASHRSSISLYICYVIDTSSKMTEHFKYHAR